MSVTLKDIAKMAQVSTATVSHVINETRYVSEDIKKRVYESIEKTGYNVNNVARSLRSNKSKIIGLIVPDISNAFFASLIEIIEKYLRETGYYLILGNSNEDYIYEKKQIEILSNQLIDGLIIAPTSRKNDTHDILKNRNYPVIFIDRKLNGYNKDSVLVDNFQGAFDAISVLIEKGHKKIGIITGLPGLTTTDERLNGYIQALSKYNVSIDNSLIKYGDSRFESGYKLTRELLNKTDMTALFVGNNSMTIGAMDYLINENIRTPEDIALIGFDDYQWSKITNPPLTVVKQPIQEIGQTAVEILMKRIEGETSEFKEYRFPTEIIFRETFKK